MASAELSAGLRVDGLTRADLAAALWERRSLVKMYGIRGTVHIFPADEFALWAAALSTLPRGDDDRRLAYLGLTRAQLAAIVDAIVGAVEERRRTREEIGAAVARRVGAWTVERTVSAFGGRWSVWQAGLGAAATDGRICFGPNEGARVTFESARRWLGPQRAVDPEDALREVFRRYLRAYGPATHAHFAQWFRLPTSRARDIAESLGDEIEQVEVDGARLLQLRGDRAARPKRVTLLIPRFDPYVVGSHPREALVPAASVERFRRSGIVPARARSGREFLVGPTPTLLVDGAITGIWEQRRARGTLEIRVQAFTRLRSDDRDAIAESAARIGAVLETDVRVSFGAISTRPHL